MDIILVRDILPLLNTTIRQMQSISLQNRNHDSVTYKRDKFRNRHIKLNQIPFSAFATMANNFHKIELRQSTITNSELSVLFKNNPLLHTLTLIDCVNLDLNTIELSLSISTIQISSDVSPPRWQPSTAEIITLQLMCLLTNEAVIHILCMNNKSLKTLTVLNCKLIDVPKIKQNLIDSNSNVIFNQPVYMNNIMESEAQEHATRSLYM